MSTLTGNGGSDETRAVGERSLVAIGERFSLAPTTFEQALTFAKIAAHSELVPTSYRGRPNDVLLAIQMGAEVGLQPMQAIQNIAVINGRPSLWGDAMMAVCQGHAECEDIVETFDEETQTARCVARRRGRTNVVGEFSRADAERAGLWNKKGPWQSYPRRMLQMRARGFALRDAFPDALRGLNSAEESEDIQREMRNANPSDDAPDANAQPSNLPEPEVQIAPEPQQQPTEPPEPPNPSGQFLKVRALIAGSQTMATLSQCVDDASKLDNGERKRAQFLYKRKIKEIEARDKEARELAESSEPAEEQEPSADG